MGHERITLRMQDGDCPTHVFTPSESLASTGPWPAVIFYMDGLAIRPTLLGMGQRLADLGYVVLLPDLFYRAGAYAEMDPNVAFASPEGRAALMPLFASTDNKRASQDTQSFIDHIDSRSDVRGKAIGVTGYCMGGGMALSVAGTYPDRIAAAASFHGGRLATDAENSPHLMAPTIRARVYVAGADNDASYPPEMAEKLEAAFTAAGVDHRCEIYAGVSHGWTMPDFSVFNEAAAERHWTELAALFQVTLG